MLTSTHEREDSVVLLEYVAAMLGSMLIDNTRKTRHSN